MAGVSEGLREPCVSSQRSFGAPGDVGREPFNPLGSSQIRTSGSPTSPGGSTELAEVLPSRQASSLPQSSVLVAVRDSGPGLDSAQLQPVFEAYYTTKSQGLGLAISRSIIEAHGGRLWAKPNTAVVRSLSSRCRCLIRQVRNQQNENWPYSRHEPHCL